MTRRLLVLILGAGALLLWASPAQAKGPLFHAPLSATVKIEGPKLRVPLVLGWRGDCGLFAPCGDINDLDSDFLALAQNLTLGSYVPDYARSYYPVPTRAQLGPAYSVHWSVIAETSRPVVFQIEQILYPFAEGRPWVVTPAGQDLTDVPIQEGPMSAPPSTLSLLASHGFPSKAEVTGGAAVGAASVEQAALSRWTWVLAVGAMALVMVGGAVAGRHRAATPA